MNSVDISCVAVRRELSNYIDEAVERALRQRMEEYFNVCKHCTAILDGTRNVIRLVGDKRVFDMPAEFGERLKASLARKLGGQRLVYASTRRTGMQPRSRHSNS